MEAAAGDNNEDILDETSTLGDAADDEMETDETAAKAEYDITINTTTKLRNHQPREKIFLLLNKNSSRVFPLGSRTFLGARCAFKVEQTAEDDVKMRCAFCSDIPSTSRVKQQQA